MYPYYYNYNLGSKQDINRMIKVLRIWLKHFGMSSTSTGLFDFNSYPTKSDAFIIIFPISPDITSSGLLSISVRKAKLLSSIARLLAIKLSSEQLKSFMGNSLFCSRENVKIESRLVSHIFRNIKESCDFTASS